MKKYFYGVGEPLVYREIEDGISAEKYLDLISGMGCRAYRSWMHLTDILKKPYAPDKEMVEKHQRLLYRAKELGIEVTGMSHEWFLPDGCKQKKGHAMPVRNLCWL